MLKVFLSLVAALCVSLPSASAGILYGTDGGTGDLVRIDPTTGASTLVGNLGIGNFGVGLAVNGSTGVAYTRNFSNLYTVNLATGATTLVGSSGPFLTGLTFDQSFTTLYSVDQSTGNFYRVNPATGASTLVGNTGITLPLDLSTDSAGAIYASSQSGGIFTINPLTGAASTLFSSVTSNGLTAISFDGTDTLYGITWAGENLVRIDLAAGTSSIIGGPNIRQDIRGLGFVPTPTTPEPATLAVVGGIALAGALGYRRRRKSATALDPAISG